MNNDTRPSSEDSQKQPKLIMPKTWHKNRSAEALMNNTNLKDFQASKNMTNHKII